MRLRLLPCISLVAVSLLGCAPRDEFRVVSGEAKEDLLWLERQILELPAISSVEEETYRLVWHPWHGNIAAITATRSGSTMKLELAHTDGFGTYTFGNLAGRYADDMSAGEFKRLALRFRDIASVPQQPERFNVDESGQPLVCLHAPAFAAEMTVNGRFSWFQRHCHPTYAADFAVVQPLVDAAAARWPDVMSKIDVRWTPPS